MTEVDGDPTVVAASRLTTWHRDLFAAVGGWTWLKSLDERVSAVSQPLYDRHRSDLVVELMHGGRWTGHSLHAALSDLPIGFWAGALVLDVIDEVAPPADGAANGRAALTLTAAGLAAAGATVATGATDWTVSDGEDRRVGLFHGLLNLGATALNAVSLLARLGGHRRLGTLASVAGFGLVGLAGFVGGHLVQGRAVMVNRVATHSGPGRWVQAIAADDLPEGAVTGVTVEGRQVLLHRRDGEVRALDDVCSHAGALLSRGPVDGWTVTCPLHESKFDLRDGCILQGPAHHPQPVLPARVRNGWIEVRGSQPRPRRTT